MKINEEHLEELPETCEYCKSDIKWEEYEDNPHSFRGECDCPNKYRSAYSREWAVSYWDIS